MTERVTILEYPNVVPPERCQALIDEYRDKLAPSSVTVRDKRLVTNARRSSSMKIALSSLPTELVFRLVDATNILPSHWERWEIVRYEAGGYYKPHVDWFGSATASELKHGGQRLYSALLYLNGPDGLKGGETYFPKLGRLVYPATGKLVVWNNTYAGVPCELAAHESRKVAEGEKWVLVNWIREREFKQEG